MVIEFSSQRTWWLFPDMIPADQKTLFDFCGSGKFNSKKTGKEYDKIVLLGTATNSRTNEKITGDFNLAAFNIDLDQDDQKEFISWDGVPKNARLEIWIDPDKPGKFKAKVQK